MINYHLIGSLNRKNELYLEFHVYIFHYYYLRRNELSSSLSSFFGIHF